MASVTSQTLGAALAQHGAPGSLPAPPVSYARAAKVLVWRRRHQYAAQLGW